VNAIRDLKVGVKWHIVSVWNMGDASLSDIARDFRLELSDLEAYMWRQPGFPGIISKLKQGAPKGQKHSKRRKAFTWKAISKEYVDAQPDS